jgi:DNA processing protein
MSGDMELVYEAFPAVGACGVADLSESAGLDVDRVRAALPMLEMTGLVSRDDTGWTRRGGQDEGQACSLGES